MGWGRFKTFIREYLTFQTMNRLQDDLYSKLNWLNDNKVNSSMIASVAEPNKILKTDQDGYLISSIIGNATSADNGVPIGALLFFPVEAIPDGWLELNGQEISRTTYPDLFALIGTKYGAGDGSTTFKIPDWRGEFLRAADRGRGVDPEREVGSFQEQQTEEHTHGYSKTVVSASFGSYTVNYDYGEWPPPPLNAVKNITNSSTTSTTFSQDSGHHGSETRPRNVAAVLCIYAKISYVAAKTPIAICETSASEAKQSATLAQQYAAEADASATAAANAAANVANSAMTTPAALYKKLVIKVTSNTTVIITADALTLWNSNSSATMVKNLNLSLATEITGPAGLETGTVAMETWYSVWVIYNPIAGQAAGLLSLSETIPTLPDGYTHLARVGWVRTNSSGYLLPTTQYGRRVQYRIDGNILIALPIVASGVHGTYSGAAPTWAEVDVSAYVPNTASIIDLVACNYYNGTSASRIAVAPNPNYGGITNANGNIPQMFITSTTASLQKASLLLESRNIYMVSDTAAALLSCTGWEDNI